MYFKIDVCFQELGSLMLNGVGTRRVWSWPAAIQLGAPVACPAPLLLAAKLHTLLSATLDADRRCIE